MKVAVVGATGLVGRMIMKVLEEREFPVDRLFLAASERSAGKELVFRGRPVKVASVMEAVDGRPDLAFFSAGSPLSREWAPVFAESGAFVIDNSSAWRMESEVPLIVPEVNAAKISHKTTIIANPNCSTIQLVMAIAPLHAEYRIKRMIISTYQAVSGTGIKAVNQLENERKGLQGEMAYPHPVDLNCLPQCDDFLDNGYTKEEMKLTNETRKILANNDLQITATAVRVPVTTGHSESVNIEFEREYEMGRVRELLSGSPGIVLYDDPGESRYPMPLIARDSDEVFVGRLRRDFSQEKSLNMWITADNLRKGAATNAIQIAEFMITAGFLT